MKIITKVKLACYDLFPYSLILCVCSDLLGIIFTYYNEDILIKWFACWTIIFGIISIIPIMDIVYRHGVKGEKV